MLIFRYVEKMHLQYVNFEEMHLDAAQSDVETDIYKGHKCYYIKLEISKTNICVLYQSINIAV